MPEQDDLQKAKNNKAERKKRDIQLALLAREGDLKAREALIVEHMYLVDKLMGFYVGKGVPEDVLYQEGCYGLILAADKFDPSQNTSLDTYASYYVNKYLWQAMMENHPHPIILKQKSARWSKLYRETTESLTEKLGRPPSNHEIAEELNISYEDAISLMLGTQQTFSLDDTTSEHETQIPSRDRGVEEEVLSELNEMCLDDFPVALMRREEEILHLRFGFGPNGKPHTFSQIAKIMNLSVDTISDYYSSAIRKLKEAKLK